MVTVFDVVFVGNEGFVPPVCGELSVTVAERVYGPSIAGDHVIEKGDVPPTVPMGTLFAENWTETME